MTRRHHKKSRNGCKTCKRRHIKCDETTPVCVNCSTANTHCSYLDFHSSAALSPLRTGSASRVAASSVSTASTTPSHAITSPETASAVLNSPGVTPSSFISSPISVGTTPPIPTPQESPDHVLLDHPPVNMLHMELLSHFYFEITQGFDFPDKHRNAAIEAFRKATPSAPYLMHEALAIAASHLSILRPEQCDFYENTSMALQTSALSLFNAMNSDIDSTNCLPIFLFSSYLSLHVLFSAVKIPDSGSNNFLDKFITYLNIRRGVQIVTKSSWDLLRQTALEPIITTSEVHMGDSEGPGTECKILWDLLSTADLSESSIQTLKEAIIRLQWFFNAERSVPQRQTGHGIAFGWPVLVSAEYTDLLLKRNPEALIILSYYAVLLHSYRRMWVVGDAGKRLIETISLHLGSYWKNWLAWPNEILKADP